METKYFSERLEESMSLETRVDKEEENQKNITKVCTSW